MTLHICQRSDASHKFFSKPLSPNFTISLCTSLAGSSDRVKRGRKSYVMWHKMNTCPSLWRRKGEIIRWFVVIAGKQRSSHASARKPNFQTKTPMYPRSYFLDQSPRRSILIIPWGGVEERFMIRWFGHVAKASFAQVCAL